jgi:WD40 repeat protein
VAFANHRALVATGGDDRTATLWDASSGELLATLSGHTETVRSFAFSPDDQTLAVAVKDGTVWFWDVDRHKLRQVLSCHPARIWNLDYSPDGARLATASGDHTVKVWDTRLDVYRQSIGSGLSPIKDLAFSSDGNRLVALMHNEDATVCEWDLHSFDMTSWPLISPDGVSSVAIDQFGTEVLVITSEDTDSKSNRLASHSQFDVMFKAGREWTTTRLRRDADPASLEFTCYAISSHKQVWATGNRSGIVTIWDVKSGFEHVRFSTRSRVDIECIEFSPDGKSLAVAAQDGVVSLFDPKTGKLVTELIGHSAGLKAIAFSADGEFLATAGADRKIVVWSTKTGREVATLLGHTDSILSLAFSPDGRSIASGSADRTIRIWDVDTFQELIVLNGHRGSVGKLRFSRDGRRLASAGTDSDNQGEILLWPPGQSTRTPD